MLRDPGLGLVLTGIMLLAWAALSLLVEAT